MPKDMIKTLEERITAMKEFDLTFMKVVKGVQTKANELALELDPKQFATEKSVTAHVRKRLQKVNNVIHRFNRDLAKAIAELEQEQE